MIGAWGYMNKNDKLDALRSECSILSMQRDRLEAKLDRLMTHLGLVEVPGPVIVVVGSQAVTPRVE